MVGRKTLVNWNKTLELSAINVEEYISLGLRAGHSRLSTVLTALQVVRRPGNDHGSQRSRSWLPPSGGGEVGTTGMGMGMGMELELGDST